jgi:hypothetical protein
MREELLVPQIEGVREEKMETICFVCEGNGRAQAWRCERELVCLGSFTECGLVTELDFCWAVVRAEA